MATRSADLALQPPLRRKMLALLIMSSAATALPFSFPQQWRDQMQQHAEPIYNHTRKFVHSVPVVTAPQLLGGFGLDQGLALSFGRFRDPRQLIDPDPRRLAEERQGLGNIDPILGVILVSALLTAAVVAVLLARRAVPEAAPIAPAQHTCCALHGGTQVQDVLLGEAAPKWDCDSQSSP